MVEPRSSNPHVPEAPAPLLPRQPVALPAEATPRPAPAAAPTGWSPTAWRAASRG